MAQPTDTPERFEVSDPSSGLQVPALSRYARPRPQPTRPDEGKDPAGDDRAQSGPPTKRRPLDPIVQAASEEWATDPSPPQPVRAAHATPTPHATPAAPAPRDDADAHAPTHAPAIREPRPRVDDDGRRRRPFWKRLAMARPHAEPESPPPPIPRDLLRPAIERIDHLTRRFEREQKALHERLDELEHNLTRMWEIEEQMSLEEVRAQLAVMRANQEEIADGLHALARRVAIGTGAVVVVFGALLVWLLI